VSRKNPVTVPLTDCIPSSDEPAGPNDIATASTTEKAFRPAPVRQLADKHEIRSAHCKENGEPKYVVSSDSGHPSCSSSVIYGLHQTAKSGADIIYCKRTTKSLDGGSFCKSFPFFKKRNARRKVFRPRPVNVHRANTVCEETEQFLWEMAHPVEFSKVDQ
jgi:hypothetical protein